MAGARNPARIGEGGENDKRDDQREIAGESGRPHTHGANDNLNPDQLKGDVGHRRDDSGVAPRRRLRRENPARRESR